MTKRKWKLFQCAGRPPDFSHTLTAVTISYTSSDLISEKRMVLIKNDYTLLVLLLCIVDF